LIDIEEGDILLDPRLTPPIFAFIPFYEDTLVLVKEECKNAEERNDDELGIQWNPEFNDINMD
jgi:hypothetical protein